MDRLERDVMYWRDYSPQISIVNAMQLDSINGLQGIFVLLFFFPLSRVIKFSIVHNPALDTVLSTTSQLVATGAYPFMSYSGSNEKKEGKQRRAQTLECGKNKGRVFKVKEGRMVE